MAARNGRQPGPQSNDCASAAGLGATMTVEVAIEGNATLATSVLASCWSRLVESTIDDPRGAIVELEDAIDEASQALSGFYLDAGFAAVRLAEPRIEVVQGGRLRITFVIDEGPRHRIGRVAVRGPGMGSDRAIPGLCEGDWFCRRRLEAGIAALRRSWERSTGKRVGVAVEVLADPRAATLDLSVVGRARQTSMVS